MAWTTYTGRGSKGEFAFPVVTIHQSGVIALSERAYSALGEPTAMDLLYDYEAPSKIGLRASGEGAYTPRASQNGKSWLISGSAFLRFVGHTPTETQRYRPPAVTDGVLEVDLRNPMPKPTRRGRRKQGDLEGDETIE